MQEVVEKSSLIYRKCIRILRLDVLDVPKKVWFYKTIIRPVIVYTCPVWIYLTASLVGRIEKLERQILRTILGQYRRTDRRYYSYRTLLENANIPGISYQMIKLTRRYCNRNLKGEDSSVVNGQPNWNEALHFIRQRCFTPDSFTYLDRLHIMQDFADRNRCFGLDRHGLARDFSLKQALNVLSRTRKLRLPTDREVAEITRSEPWFDWNVPLGIFEEYPHIVGI